MRIPRNYVAIRPAGRFTDICGFPIIEDDDNIHQPNYGEVVVVPDLLYTASLPFKDPIKGSVRAKERQLERQGSLSVHTSSVCPLSVGDMVYFKYIYTVSDDDQFQDLILVPYDDLYCVVDPEVRMLNDYCLVKPDESIEFGDLHRYQRFKRGVGRLMFRPEGVIRYADHDHPTIAPPISSIVYFKFLRAPRMESSLHQKLNETGYHSLLKVRAKDIGFFFQN